MRITLQRAGLAGQLVGELSNVAFTAEKYDADGIARTKKKAMCEGHGREPDGKSPDHGCHGERSFVFKYLSRLLAEHCVFVFTQ